VTGSLEFQPQQRCPVSAGSLIFHHGCTLHCSGANQSTTWRRALILHYAAAGAKSEDDRLNEQVSLKID